MPNWKALIDEITASGSVLDIVRRKYLAQLHEVTDRNVIIYYSAWLQKRDLLQQGVVGFDLDDSDKNGFMAAIHELDRTKGLDLILHTPGGDAAATESLVDYLRAMSGDNIRAIVPQIAMSAGTMVACACKEIVMGKHSSLGPIDPQMGGLAAHGIIEEFDRARQEIRSDPSAIPLWQPIIAKYPPTLIGECQKAIDWAEEMVRFWLETGMFAGDTDASEKAARVVAEFGDHALTKSHGRHISLQKAREAGLAIVVLEDDDALQEAVLSVHHACITTLGETNMIKLIENHNGVAFAQGFYSR